MNKRYFFLVAMVFCMMTAMAQRATISNRVKLDKKAIEERKNVKGETKESRVANPYVENLRGEIVNTTLLTEDFSKFTAGSVEDPDDTRLDDPVTGLIDDAYFHTSEWVGLEVYQAGGCAFIKFSEEFGETGMIILPKMNTGGAITIKCRMKSTNPDGDDVGYNINDEYMEVLDSNVASLYDDEWTEVEWFTTYGGENSYIYLYSYYYDVYIDDIEITHHYMPTPEIYDETNVTENSFTANWEDMEDADVYNVYLYAQHTAATDETYYLINTDFSDIVSDGTTDNPEELEDYEVNYGSWYAYLPLYANGALGLSGEYSLYYDYATFTSPQLDLSSDGGKFTISFKLKGTAGDNFDLFLYTATAGYYDVAAVKEITLESNEWTEYSFEMNYGYEYSIIDFVYYGLNNIFIDDLKLSQEMKQGEVKTTLIQETLTEESSLDFVVDEYYKNDILYYQLYAIKYIWTHDPYYGDYIAGGITSDLTEPRMAPTNTIGIDEDLETLSNAHAYFNNGQLHVINPDNEMVSIYSINGACIYRKMTNGATDINLPKGAYIVKVGNKTTKVVNN